MKRVSFKVANAIKEAGYPQDENICYTFDGELYDWNNIEEWNDEYYARIAAPYAMKVWLWLWKEKKIRFDIKGICEFANPNLFVGCDCSTLQFGGITTREYCDPEEAITAAIEYLVDNDLIK